MILFSGLQGEKKKLCKWNIKLSSNFGFILAHLYFADVVVDSWDF